MWSLLVILALSNIVHCSCPDGFDLVSEGECRGKYGKEYMYYDKAVGIIIDKCKEIDAQPVLIHNDEQQSYWSSRAPAEFTGDPSFTYFVTGIVCNTSTKQWEWADGSTLDYEPPIHPDELDESCTTTGSWDLFNDGLWLYGNTEAGFHNNQFQVDVYCTKQLKQPIPSPEGCESFEVDSEDGVCYQVGTVAENWSDAQMICKKLGANLASIHNEQENSFVRRLAVSLGAVSGVFLGGTKSGKGDNFGWIDGSSWDYEKFYPGFPITGLGDCLAMDTSTSTGQWMNLDCTAKLPVVCIRDQKAVTEPACDSNQPKEGEIITSPGFPYTASTPCDFFLIVDEGKKVELEIILLEANSCCDSLTLFDGYLGGVVIAKLSGTRQNTTFTTATSNVMRVSWQPNGGVNVRGVAMQFRGV